MNTDLFRTDLPETAQKILCLIPAGVSMAISATPFLEALSHAYPQAHVTCIADEKIASLLDVAIDRFLPPLRANAPLQNLQTLMRLSLETFDLLIDCFTPHPCIDGQSFNKMFNPSQIKNHLLYRVFAGARFSIGFTVDPSHYRQRNDTEPRHWLFKALNNMDGISSLAQGNVYSWFSQRKRLSINIPTPKARILHEQCIADLMLRLIIDDKKIQIAAPLFRKRIKEIQAPNFTFQGPNTLRIGLHFGGSKGSFHWPIENSMDFVRKLVTQFAQVEVHLIGDEPNDEVVQALEEMQQTKGILNHLGRTKINELASVVLSCDMVVTTFGGPLHMADAYNIPLIVLASGSVSHTHYAGRQARQILLKVPVPCSPCLLATCNQPVSCMEQVCASQVLEAVNAMIADRFSRVRG